MSDNGYRKNVVIRAPAALASVKGGVPSALESAAVQGIQMDPRDMVSAQQAEIRELRRELAVQTEAAGRFANLVACLAAMVLEERGQPSPVDLRVLVGRRLTTRFDGAKVALEHTPDLDIEVQIAERMA